MSRRPGAWAVLMAAVPLVALSACGHGRDQESVANRVEYGVPAEWDGPESDPLDGSPVVGWLGDDEFGVITRSSSSCPPVADAIEVDAPDAVQIHFVQPDIRDCTADDAPYTHVFELPDQVTGRPIAVSVVLYGDPPVVLTLS